MKKSWDRGPSAGARPSFGASRIRKDSFGVAGDDLKRKSHIPVFKNTTNASMAPPTTFGVNPRQSRKLSGCNNVGLGRVSFNAAESSKKESRPVFDKSFQQACIMKMLKFLSDQEYGHAISTRSLQTPQTKDFTRVFEFLYNFLDPTYKVAGKYDEEIPRMFKELGYPVAVTKSQLQTVGTQHSWPPLLAALDWLRQLIEMSLRILANPLPIDFDAPLEQQHRMDYMIKSYQMFMEGNDDFSSAAQELQDKLLGDSCKDLEALENETKRYQRAYDELQSQEDPLPKLQQELEVYNTDVGKFKAYLEELEGHVKNMEEEERVLLKTCQNLDGEFKAVRESISKTQHIIQTQEVNVSDFEEMRKILNNQFMRKQQLETELTEIKQEVASAELLASNNKEKTESLCKDYNYKCRQAQLIPKSAQNAHDQDFEMRMSYGADALARSSALKMLVNKTLKDLKEENRVLSAQLFTEEETTSRLEEMVADAELQLRELEREGEASEKELGFKKEVIAKEMVKCQEELKSVQRKLWDKRSSAAENSTVAEAERKLQDANDNLKKIEAEAVQKKKEIDEILVKSVERETEYRKYVTEEVVGKMLHNCMKVKKYVSFS